MPYSLAFDGKILSIELTGALGPEDLERLRVAVEAFEAGCAEPPDRIFDLGALEGITIGFDDLNALAVRRHSTLPRPIRSALIATSPIQLGYARMYQTVSEHPLLTVRVFPTRAGALDWLSSPP
jgi:hypothetical protein